MIGSPLARLEDERLLRGAGRFVANQAPAGALHARLVRSPHAHARIRAIGLDGARAVPGVVAVYGGAELAAAGLGPLPCIYPLSSRDGSPPRAPERPLLAVERVRYCGEGVALVVAESPAAARAGAEAVAVDYQPLAAAATIERGEPCFDWEKGDAAAVEAAFAGAARTCAIRVVNNRIAVSPLEPRAAIGEWDAGAGQATLRTQSQGVHLIRRVIAAALGLDEERLRVVTGDVGGSFGMKLVAYPEQALVVHAARELGRPVAWVSERGEGFLSDAHGRDHLDCAEIALDADGRFLAVRAHLRANLGAYLSTLGPMIPTDALAKVFGHCYRIPALYLRVEGVLTHSAPTDAYRGAGKPEITYLLERLIDKAARACGIDRVALRRRNLIEAAEMPYTTPFGLVWDCGDFARVLDAALERSGWARFEERRARALARGRRRGIGLGMYLHATGGDTGETCRVRLAADGRVEVHTGTQSSGQGHETAFAQVVASRLEIPLDRVRVVQGDSALLERGGGTGGSSSLPIGAATLARASERFLEVARELAAETLEVAAEDLEYGAGRFRVVGTDLAVGLLELPAAETGEGFARGCLAEADFAGENLTCPNGAYVCEVEIDPETGEIELCAFTGVDDLGTLLNPAIARGQVVGGLAQAIGQALLEEAVYDPDSGQLVTGSFLDYALPRASDLPRFDLVQTGEPTGNNPLGMKGAGECGNIGGCAAVINAVVDALGHDAIDMPATPERVWRALAGGAARSVRGA